MHKPRVNILIRILRLEGLVDQVIGSFGGQEEHENKSLGHSAGLRTRPTAGRSTKTKHPGCGIVTGTLVRLHSLE